MLPGSVNHMFRDGLLQLFIVLLLVSFHAKAQRDIVITGTATIQNGNTAKNIHDTISYKGNFWGKIRYSYKDRNNLKYREIRPILNIDEKNETLISNAEGIKVLSTALTLGGYTCITYALVNSFTGNGNDWILLGTGAGILIIDIPISSFYEKNIKRAIRRYNSLQ